MAEGMQNTKRGREGPSSGVKGKGKLQKIVAESGDDIDVVIEKEANPVTKERAFNVRAIVCERMVDRTTIGNTDVILILERYGLKSFFNPVGKYCPSLVREFYLNLKVMNESLCSMTAVVRGKDVTVTPNRIASYLKFRRPATCKVEYSFSPKYEVKDFTEIVKKLCDDPSRYKNKFFQGMLNEDFRLLNKIVHHNIYPKGNQKILSNKLVTLLYAMMNKKRIDFAKLMWDYMKTFVSATEYRSALPFGVMITHFIMQDKVKPASDEPQIAPEFGAITQRSMSKSKTLSQVGVARGVDVVGERSATPNPHADGEFPGLFEQLMGKMDSLSQQMREGMNVLSQQCATIMQRQDGCDAAITQLRERLEYYISCVGSDRGLRPIGAME